MYVDIYVMNKYLEFPPITKKLTFGTKFLTRKRKASKRKARKYQLQ